MPDTMTENIRLNCIEVYDMSRPPSKNPAYRRWQEYGPRPTLHDAVGMYAATRTRQVRRETTLQQAHGSGSAQVQPR